MTQAALLSAWHCMGKWRWPMLLPIVVCLALTPFAMEAPPQWQDWDTRSLNGTQIRLQTRGHFKADKRIELRFTKQNAIAEELLIGNNGKTIGRVQFSPDPANNNQQSVAHYEFTLLASQLDKLTIDLTNAVDEYRNTISWHIGPVLPGNGTHY